jgi:hypothetical protein
VSAKADVWQGTLALMVLKTLDTPGALHGYGIARRIERTSGDLLSVNYETTYPALLKLRSVDLGGGDSGSRRQWFCRLFAAGLARGAGGSDAGVALRVNLAGGQQRDAEHAKHQARRLWREVVDVAAVQI